MNNKQLAKLIKKEHNLMIGFNAIMTIIIVIAIYYYKG